MVLQREMPLVFWGWAAPGEKIIVELGEARAETVASASGEWKTTLPAMGAKSSIQLVIRGSNTLTFEDVSVGEVWLCSGQSNMEMGIGMVAHGKEEIAAANYPGIRLFMVPNRWSAQACNDLEQGEWKPCAPKSVAEGGWGGFSAAGYFFGRELHKKLGVNIGLIDATWGGTKIESWSPPEGFAEVPALKSEFEKVKLADPTTTEHRQRLGQALEELEQWTKKARLSLEIGRTNSPPPAYPPELLPVHDLQQSTALFNGMIYPIHPFPIRGAIWYQGESNSSEGRLYTERMKALVTGWRKIWAEGEFPFYYVQIAPYNYGGDAEKIAEFWEAQALAQANITNSGMIVINDIGNLKDIHPANKQEVGRRLSLWALARTYSQPNLVYSGPVFKGLTLKENKLRLSFDHAEGLRSRDGKPLAWFEIIDAAEGGYARADAVIENNEVIVSSPEVRHPVAVRFAWSMLAEPNLENSAGLPAGAFQAGKVPRRDLLRLKIPEAPQYEVLYDLNLSRLSASPAYDLDNSGSIKNRFDRVAYFLELEKQDRTVDYVYVSMDAFTNKVKLLGLPTFKSGARFQQNVQNMNVWSNVKGIVTGTNLAGGNIEFWPHNYGPANGAKVPHASDQTYDFGDDPGEPADGYGSMQIHNHDARQTLLSLNHWREGARADVGIGNQASGNPDWTFAANLGTYASGRLRVLVRVKE